jgi:hypothetical protein
MVESAKFREPLLEAKAAVANRTAKPSRRLLENVENFIKIQSPFGMSSFPFG